MARVKGLLAQQPAGPAVRPEDDDPHVLAPRSTRRSGSARSNT
jgi:hypothetical protein